MPRAPVLPVGANLDDSTGVEGEHANRSKKKTLTYDRAEAFYGIRLQLPSNPAMRQAAYSMLAMWQAAHNTDYYITKYGTKALEQLQNLIGQFALGLRRLELEEQQERDAAGAAVLVNQQDYKQRARRVTLRSAMASNRGDVGIVLRDGSAYSHRSSCPQDVSPKRHLPQPYRIHGPYVSAFAELRRQLLGGSFRRNERRHN